MRSYYSVIIDGRNTKPKNLEILLPWLKEASFENAKVEYFNDHFIWYSGVWKQGVWEDGVWGTGRWENGTWKSGIWNNGEWVNGIWKNGEWKNGIWWNGNWEGGVWEDGEWAKGRINGIESEDPPKDTFYNQIQPLKQNELIIQKELRSIRNETLYGIADRLLKI